MYSATVPTRVCPGTTASSLSARPSAMAPSAAGLQACARRSIMFIPAPSDVSMGAHFPSSSEHMNDEMSEIWPVVRYIPGCCCASFMIWFPVNRSYARDPVRSDTAWGPPSAASSASHWAVVDVSIQIGDREYESMRSSSPKASAIDSAPASMLRSSASAPSCQKTEPCCWPDPETARIFAGSTLVLIFLITTSRASTNIFVGASTTPSPTSNTPFVVPYCERSLSKLIATVATVSIAPFTTVALRPWVDESSPRNKSSLLHVRAVLLEA
mmetsp:Transcript_20335/g.52739  ORF Transcript_20335/g.52739 Transcript_20335/m.52739 type:complete len:270 (-) Transcript_20335:88-897(-)